MTCWILIAAVLLAQRPAKPPAKRPAAPKAPAVTEPQPTPARWPLRTITITGAKVFPVQAILRATGLKVEEMVSVADFKQAVQRLTDTGGFETISFRYEPLGKAMAVTFQVQEVVDLYPVGFERLDVPDAELMRALTERVPLFGPQVPATGAMAQRIVQALEAHLGGRKVVGRLASIPGGGGLRMTFRPAEAPPSITFVKFEGSKALRDVDLQGAFYQAAVGVPYVESRLHELLDSNIRPKFEEKGRLRVRFGPFRVEESKAPAGVQVTVPVAEGDEFRFGETGFAGNSAFPNKDLARLARLEPGEMANFALVGQSVASIERLYQRTGFLHVKTSVERKVDDEKKSVNLVLRVEEGGQYRFRTLEVKGIDINAAAAVRRRWGIQRGQPFDGAYPETFLKRIHDEAMFDRLAKITHRVTIDEQEKAVDVELVFVAEAPKPRKKAP